MSEEYQPSPAARVLAERKARSRAYLRSLPPEEKIRMLQNLQHQYYQFLELREQTGGKPIPERWKKWRSAQLEL
ncbi:MAG TPA: hypothetical protein PKC65_03335 [Pyrinomonadaceae bacterium]|nr:hypothetical protein [Pyrinomonadaceae bacterium]